MDEDDWAERMSLLDGFLADEVEANQMMRLPGARKLERLQWTVERAGKAENPRAMLQAMLAHPERYPMPHEQRAVRTKTDEGAMPQEPRAARLIFRAECPKCAWAKWFPEARNPGPECPYCHVPSVMDPTPHRLV